MMDYDRDKGKEKKLSVNITVSCAIFHKELDGSMKRYILDTDNKETHKTRAQISVTSTCQ